MRFRQVHLDFHTSEAIPGIGEKFNRQQFQDQLKLGSVDSITVFSKCHHGWAYHPSEANVMHPELHFDLLGEMIEAAHAINVKTPVYLSAGLDEKLARVHPEWLVRDENDSTNWAKGFMVPGYHVFCFNSPYLEQVLIPQIVEVVTRYDVDGVFLDIVKVVSCYCHHCVASLRAEGSDPRNKQAAKRLWERTYANYTKRVREAVDAVKQGLPVFHNGGHIRCGRRDLAAMNTHLELESLPTGSWGYDHFPFSARYTQGLGMPFLGMTGKFHTSWGEFGGFKHPNALRYETSLCLANGARCSIGDQLHPNGAMNETTYRLIGQAYSEVERKEPWCSNVASVADIGLLSVEALHSALGRESPRVSQPDSGAIRMLSEGNYLFDVLDWESEFEKYKVLILPDMITLTEPLRDRLQSYLHAGGRILATGQSGLYANDVSPESATSGFAIDFGVNWLGPNPYKPDYFRPHFELSSLGSGTFVFYSQGQNIELSEGGTELGSRQNPYFNRDVFTFSSHQHTPNVLSDAGPGMVESPNGIYIAWNIFEDYATKGSLALKETVLHALNLMLPDKTLYTNLPAQGIVTLMKQAAESRYVNHLLYASPVKRGTSVEVIEDILPLYLIEVQIRLDRKPARVYLAPDGQELPFQWNGEYVSYTVPRLECHQMVVLDV
ncbi:alpha-amylase family protein [Paenibacillus koleovorans]|uniref:alpha-amylase family protein n=1 Tax=Paenibacillus koleovorans TaxID=121608 RepID=UPI000FDB3314|nr:alpha-amylase family protein [Paenibacillus koleovorans]